MKDEVQVAQGCQHLQIVPPAPDWGQEKTADSTRGGERAQSQVPMTITPRLVSSSVPPSCFTKFTQFDHQGFLSSKLFLQLWSARDKHA